MFPLNFKTIPRSLFNILFNTGTWTIFSLCFFTVSARSMVLGLFFSGVFFLWIQSFLILTFLFYQISSSYRLFIGLKQLQPFLWPHLSPDERQHGLSFRTSLGRSFYALKILPFLRCLLAAVFWFLGAFLLNILQLGLTHPSPLPTPLSFDPVHTLHTDTFWFLNLFSQSSFATPWTHGVTLFCLLTVSYFHLFRSRVLAFNPPHPLHFIAASKKRPPQSPEEASPSHELKHRWIHFITLDLLTLNLLKKLYAFPVHRLWIHYWYQCHVHQALQRNFLFFHAPHDGADHYSTPPSKPISIIHFDFLDFESQLKDSSDFPPLYQPHRYQLMGLNPFNSFAQGLFIDFLLYHYKSLHQHIQEDQILYRALQHSDERPSSWLSWNRWKRPSAQPPLHENNEPSSTPEPPKPSIEPPKPSIRRL